MTKQFIAYHCADKRTPVAAGTDKAKVQGTAIRRVLGLNLVGPYDTIAVREMVGKTRLTDDEFVDLITVLDGFFAELLPESA